MEVIDADWLAICRRIVAAQRRIFATTVSSEERTVYEGVGEGGDHTLAIDRRCEDVVFAELERLAGEGASFVAISEERGEVSFGAGGEARVVIDPIDGSLNARRTIPSHSFSLAVASGTSMADVEFGLVHDFGADEEFSARRGGGAWLGEREARVASCGEKLEVVGMESAEPDWARAAMEALSGKAYRLRVVGSLAITGAYVAAGRFDGMLSLRDCRSVDVAAAQLLIREAGGALAFGQMAPEEVPFDLGIRFPIAGACDEAALPSLLAAQQAAVSA